MSMLLVVLNWTATSDPNKYPAPRGLTPHPRASKIKVDRDKGNNSDKETYRIRIKLRTFQLFPHQMIKSFRYFRQNNKHNTAFVVNASPFLPHSPPNFKNASTKVFLYILFHSNF